MGYINHHAIVCTAWDKKSILSLHEKAKEIFGQQVSELIRSPINGYVSFFVAPDGSKEGWEESDIGNKRREDFLKWCTEDNGFYDAVEIYYGGDEPDLNGIKHYFEHYED